MTHDYGMTLAYSTTDGSYTTLTRVIDLGEGKDTLKVILLNILANTTHKHGAGTITQGPIPLTVEFNKTDYNTMRGIFTARTTYWWKITDTDGNITKGRALINEFPNVLKFGEDERLKYPMSLHPTDADWTFTAV